MSKRLIRTLLIWNARAAACLFLFLLFVQGGLQRTLAVEPRPSVPDQIRAEALRPNDDPIGRPLPLACSWTCGHYRSTVPPAGVPRTRCG